MNFEKTVSLSLCFEIIQGYFTVQLSRFVSLFSFVFAAVSATAHLLYHVICHLSTIFSKFFKKIFLKQFHERRRGDLNPRAAVNDLHPFQGCPFGQLGYFSMPARISSVLQNNQSGIQTNYEAERVGFEPTRPCGQTVFKTASL